MGNVNSDTEHLISNCTEHVFHNCSCAEMLALNGLKANSSLLVKPRDASGSATFLHQPSYQSEKLYAL